MLRNSAVPLALLGHLLLACGAETTPSAPAAAAGGPGGRVEESDAGPAAIPPPEESPAACGGVDCTSLPHVDPSKVRCLEGQCQVDAACKAGWGHCGPLPTSGCETDLTTGGNCGGCGVQCGGATAVCGPPAQGDAPRCVSSCAETVAPTTCGDACVDTQTDPLHCGGCSPCPGALHGQATCSAGICGFTCDAGYHRCGTACREDTSATACGPSCVTCAAPASNGVAACIAGACSALCDEGYYAEGSSCKPTYTVSGPAGNVVAFDVDASGGMVAVARGTGELRVQCFKADGIAAGPDSQLTAYDQATRQLGRVMVARSRGTKQSLVIWHLGGASDEARYAYLDEQCHVEKSASLATGRVYLQGVAIDDKGAGAALLHLTAPKQRQLIHFHETGVPTAINDLGELGDYDSHMAMRRSTGETLVATSTYAAPSFKRHYRRFGATGAPIDAAFVEVPGLLSSGSYVRAGMNDNGDFVLLGESSRIPNVWTATFHNGAGAVVATLPAAEMWGSADTFVPITSGGDFVWPIRTNGAFTRERRSPAGTLLGASPWGTPHMNTLELRLDANNAVYMILAGGTGRTVKKNPFPL